MKFNIYLITDSSGNAAKYDRVLRTASYQVHFADPFPQSPPGFQPSVAIFIQTTEFLYDHRFIQDLDPSLPVLIVDAEPSGKLPNVDSHDNRLVDYLPEPVSDEQFLLKIRFLEKAAKLSAEHAGYLQSHDSFLDWFSSHDGLTGLYNRHHFNKTFQQEFEKSISMKSELSLLVLDIDYFNELNRTCGHTFGDFVLNELSARLTRATGDTDLCFRFTGGEFIILQPGTDLDTALSTAQKIRAACTEKQFINKNTSRSVSISIGIANSRNHQPSSGDDLVNMAETALYSAKASGRNRCMVYTPNDPLSDYQGQGSLDALKLSISRLLEKTRKSAIASLQLLARDIAGEEHRVHIDKVSWYANLLGKRLGLPPPVIQTLQNAVIIQASIRLLMHNDLLSKPVELDDVERKVINDLPYKIAEITEVFSYFDQERNILLTRGEKYDGSGFPDGLQGSEIPLGSRIINIIDSFAAMGAERPYRKKLSPKEILEELKRETGKQFDPILVIRLLDVIKEKNLLEIDHDLVEQTQSELHASYPEL